MIVTRAPLRLSFFGGGSDFPEVFSRQRGAVLSTAIGFSTHVAASTPPPGVFERPIRLFHERIERCADVAQIDHPLMRAGLRTWPDSRPLEVHASGDLPSGSGLGSSSSFCVALLAALDELEGARRQPIELALSAIELERRVEKGAVGYQDQVMAALGGFRRIEFRSEDDVRAESLPVSAERLRQLEECLALVYVGGRRSAPSLERRKLERVERNLDTLRAMVEQVDRAADLLCGGGELSDFGAMLGAAWSAKQRLAPGVSSPAIDSLYRAATGAGALGGKLLGAGGGGFLLLFVPPERRETVRRSLDRPLLDVAIARPGVTLLTAASRAEPTAPSGSETP